MRVKLATYNIQFGYGQDGAYDLNRIVETVRGEDIVCLQEVTRNWRACGHDDQPREIAGALDMYSIFAPGFEVGANGGRPRAFGNMVLSRWPILYSRVHSLPRPPAAADTLPEGFYPLVDLPRVALETVIDVPGHPLRVMSIHLSHLPGGQRLAQIAALKDIVTSITAEAELWSHDPSLSAFVEDQAAPPVPSGTILCGDFNCEPHHDEYAELRTTFQDGWLSAENDRGEGGSCVETDGRMSILDYCFVSSEIAGVVTTARVDQTNQSSDHFPLFFELDL